ncbi:hypothetical protein RJ641_015158 [Dillenia turbinata]|uniref:Uncharacterized protein n=1 Tax=Dillenia turbinata TaxID=194707 RepID=A0AAN8URJ8_9MAGN
MVIIKPSSPPQSQAFVFDFQPKDPEDMNVALAALLGREVPALERYQDPVMAIDIVCKFNDRWQTGLRIRYHDCRDYTNGLVEYLTGEKYVLKRLKKSSVLGSMQANL